MKSSFRFFRSKILLFHLKVWVVYYEFLVVKSSKIRFFKTKSRFLHQEDERNYVGAVNGIVSRLLCQFLVVLISPFAPCIRLWCQFIVIFLWLPVGWEEKTFWEKPQLPTVIVLPPMYPMPTSYSVYGIIKGRLIGFL